MGDVPAAKVKDGARHEVGGTVKDQANRNFGNVHGAYSATMRGCLGLRRHFGCRNFAYSPGNCSLRNLARLSFRVAAAFTALAEPEARKYSLYPGLACTALAPSLPMPSPPLATLYPISRCRDWQSAIIWISARNISASLSKYSMGTKAKAPPPCLRRAWHSGGPSDFPAAFKWAPTRRPKFLAAPI